MTEQKGMNKKCPYAYNTNNQEFDYCQTNLCMAWNEEDGYCQRLVNGQCECNLKEMFNMAGIR